MVVDAEAGLVDIRPGDLVGRGAVGEAEDAEADLDAGLIPT